MKPSMKAYAEIFGDFIINDGTHNVDKYGLVAMYNTLVDSLGKSVISCYSQYRSEHSAHISSALKHFGLDRKGATFMTDDGSAYHLVSSLLGMNHVLCTKHYHNLIFPAQVGLGHLAHEFQQSMFSAIYDNFKSPEALQHHLISCQERFGHKTAAAKFIAQLQKDKEKYVARTQFGSSVLDANPPKGGKAQTLESRGEDQKKRSCGNSVFSNSQHGTSTRLKNKKKKRLVES